MSGLMELNKDKDTLTINIEVKVSIDEKRDATLIIPPELRLTERLVAFLNDAMKARGAKLKHWTITIPEQEKELEALPNVVVGQDQA